MASQESTTKDVKMLQFMNVTFRYHIVNSGFDDSKIFNTNILVKLAIAAMMLWCFFL